METDTTPGEPVLQQARQAFCMYPCLARARLHAFAVAPETNRTRHRVAYCNGFLSICLDSALRDYVALGGIKVNSCIHVELRHTDQCQGCATFFPAITLRSDRPAGQPPTAQREENIWRTVGSWCTLGVARRRCLKNEHSPQQRQRASHTACVGDREASSAWPRSACARVPLLYC